VAGGYRVRPTFLARQPLNHGEKSLRRFGRLKGMPFAIHELSALLSRTAIFAGHLLSSWCKT
jgi:hypothetical protein